MQSTVADTLVRRPPPTPGNDLTASNTATLIVNADDFGVDPNASDETVRAFRAGRVTGATAMVYMADSDRAASLAAAEGLPVGLHVNLTDPLTDPRTPTPVRERHLRASAHFAKGLLRRRTWVPSAAVRHDVAAALADQVDRFEQLFGAPPSHVDGHNHVHFCPDVAASAPLAAFRKRRNVLWSWPSRGGAMARLRALRRELTYRGMLSTRFFFDIDEMFAAGPGAAAATLDRARGASAEVMAHPGFPHEMEWLMSDEWGEALRGRPLGSYEALEW